MRSTEAPGEDVRTAGLRLIATPTGKHWHVMPCKAYDSTAHRHAMALHDIGTMGLEDLTVIACATHAEYGITRDDDAPNLEQDADHYSPRKGPWMATKLSFPRTHTNADVRSREYLTPSEVEKLRKAARRMGRHGVRNDAMILLAYRHGLRVGELVHLRWDQVDLQTGLLHVRRLKKGLPSTHPLTGAELRALRQLHRVAADAPYVFLSERGGPMTVNNAQKMIQKVGEVAHVGFVVHFHMCRHGAGYKLANDGQDTRAIQLYLGHKSINHTARYCALSPERFRDFWQD